MSNKNSERAKRAWVTIRERQAMKDEVKSLVDGTRVTGYNVVEDKNQIAIIIKK
jgi:hypothetical protein